MHMRARSLATPHQVNAIVGRLSARAIGIVDRGFGMTTIAARAQQGERVRRIGVL